MDNSDYISIAEAAAKANISRQTLYNRLDKDLTKYVKVIDNKKRLHINVLEYLVKSNVKENVQVDNDNVQFDKVIDILNQQLKEKDKQIAELQSLLSKTQDNLSHAIAVQAGMIQTQLQAPMPAPPPEPAKEQDQPSASATPAPPAPDQQDKKKRNWWQRLWDT